MRNSWTNFVFPPYFSMYGDLDYCQEVVGAVVTFPLRIALNDVWFKVLGRKTGLKLIVFLTGSVHVPLHRQTRV